MIIKADLAYGNHLWLCYKAFKAADEKGGLKSWTIKSEEIAEDGQSATVKADLVYGKDEAPVETTYNLVLVNNEWKLKS